MLKLDIYVYNPFIKCHSGLPQFLFTITAVPENPLEFEDILALVFMTTRQIHPVTFAKTVRRGFHLSEASIHVISTIL